MNQLIYLEQLKSAFDSFYPISIETWKKIKPIFSFKTVKKGECILNSGDTATNIHFVCKGLFRTYYTDKKGNIYNKNLFFQNSFPASMVSLLRQEESYMTIEALEDSTIINFEFKDYKHAIDTYPDMKDLYIAYMEKQWVIEKDLREISIVMQDATQRYLDLLQKHPKIESRVQQLHIAAHLGISPTQLSRIRKDLKK